MHRLIVYGVKPELPAFPGIEACAEIVESRCSEFKIGDRVIPLTRLGTWRSELIASGKDLIKIPIDCDPVQASMLKVNPATAWCLLTKYTKLEEGDWIVQNASNSSVGQCVIQLAKSLGVKTINFVRREELVEELTELGGDIVVLDRRGENDFVLQRTNGVRPKIAFNAVGGDSALNQMDLLETKGIQVTYGAMSRRSLKVPNRFLIFKNLSLKGLWITELVKNMSREEVEGIYTQLIDQVECGELLQKVQEIYPVKSLKDALKVAGGGRRSGKVVLDFSSSESNRK